jgi:hypothetical protein
MLIDTSTLVALVSSRICHDLVSPVAALTTALDILDDDHGADMREQAMDLIRNSAAQAGVKLEFMRATFGAGTIGVGQADLGELQKLSERFFARIAVVVTARQRSSRCCAFANEPSLGGIGLFAARRRTGSKRQSRR